MAKKLLVLAGVIVGVIIVLAVVASFLVDAEKFRPTIQTKLQEALGRDVQIGKLSFSLFSGAVRADNISIADDPAFSQSPFITAKSLDVGVEVMPLIFSKALRVNSVTLDSPHVIVLTDNDGKANYSSLGATNKKKTAEEKPSAAPEISVQQLHIKNGTFEMGHVPSKTKPVAFTNVDVVVKDISDKTKMPLTISANGPGGGKIKADGTVGPIAAGDMTATPFDMNVSTDGLELAALAPQAGIAGLANVNAKVTSDGKHARAEGNGEVQKLKAAANGTPSPKPVTVHYVADYGVQSKNGTLKAEVGTAKAQANIAGDYDLRGETPKVGLKVNAPNLPIDELQSLLPAFGVTLPSGSSLQGGTLNANLNVDGPTDRLNITGPISIANTKLAGFDLSSKMSSIAQIAGIKTGSDTTIQMLSSNVNVVPEGVRADAINLVIPALGQVTGAGTIANNALNFKMLAKVQSTGTGLLGSAGTKDIPFAILGTTSNPSFKPDVGAIAAGALMDQITKGKGTGNQNTDAITNALGGLFGGKKKK